MGPEKRLSGLVSIDAAGAAVKSLPTPPERFRWTNTPGTRRLKVQFDGDWLSLRSRIRTERTKIWTPTPNGDAAGVARAAGCRALVGHGMVALSAAPTSALRIAWSAAGRRRA
jgi:hypothetical protein